MTEVSNLTLQKTFLISHCMITFSLVFQVQIIHLTKFHRGRIKDKSHMCGHPCNLVSFCVQHSSNTTHVDPPLCTRLIPHIKLMNMAIQIVHE